MNEQKKWYELPINERLKQVYKRFSIEEFWNWWSNAEDVYMELRINNKRMMFDYAKKYKVPVSKSGIFVNSAWKLRKAIEYFRNHDTIWYGVNPRRRIPDKYGRMRFQGLDVNVSEIRFLFIDIDRRTKNGAATNKDLMDADFVAEKVKDELDSVGFANNYIKICSGNGVQILFKLDVPIKIPGPKYDEQNGMYIEDTLFKKAKNTIRKGIGEILESYSKKLDVNINAEIDKTCFNLNRVGALPFTYNFKHGERIPRGIVELEQKGVNQGVSDYINKLHDMKDFKSQEKKSYTEKNFDTVSLEYLKIENKLHKNKVIDLMLNHRFPDGYINNTYSTGATNGIKYIGGLVGTNSSQISTSYATGYVEGDEELGGIVGDNINEGYIVNCRYDKETTGLSGGITTEKMMQKYTFINILWNFSDTWEIEQFNTYPYFQWQDNNIPTSPQ